MTIRDRVRALPGGQEALLHAWLRRQAGKGPAEWLRPYGLRDRIVLGVANAVLHLASRRCRLMIDGLIRYGMLAADRDNAEEQ